MQRAVIDTNIWVSGLIWHGPPRVFVQRILSRQLHSIVSAEMVAEFQRVLNYPRISSVLLKRGLVAVDLAMQIRLVSELVVSSPLQTPVCRDPDDDAILACALAGAADVIVSGDSDLLVLAHYQGIQILTASQSLARLSF